MSIKLSSSAFKQVIEEDLEALHQHMPDILERQHIEGVLKYYIQHFYPSIESHTAAHTSALRESVNELEGKMNREVDLLHTGIHVLITNARIAVTKLGIEPDKSESVDRLFYDLDVEQGKLMDALSDKIKNKLQ